MTTTEKGSLVVILKDISNLDFSGFSAEKDEIYVTCAYDLNRSLLQYADHKTNTDYNLIRYYGNCKEFNRSYLSLITCVLFSHKLQRRYVFYSQRHCQIHL